jgi:hypothetical protein
MTKSEFQAKLSKGFDRFNAEVLADIGDFIGQFTDGDRRRLWDEFNDSYTLVSAPRRAVFVQLATKMGLSRVSNDRVATWEYVCYLCTAKFGRTHRYPIDEPTCPTCGNRDRPYFALIRAGGETNLEEAVALVAKYPPGPHPVYGRPHLKGLTNVRRESPLANPSLATSGARLAGVSARSDNQPSPEVNKCATEVAIEEQGGANDIVF